jgi:hypothetical protein
MGAGVGSQLLDLLEDLATVLEVLHRLAGTAVAVGATVGVDREARAQALDAVDDEAEVGAVIVPEADQGAPMMGVTKREVAVTVAEVTAEAEVVAVEAVPVHLMTRTREGVVAARAPAHARAEMITSMGTAIKDVAGELMTGVEMD